MIAVVAVIGMPHLDISYRFDTESTTAIAYVASKNGSHGTSRVCESEQGFRPIEMATEAEIQRHLRDLDERKTIVTIAHRLSTIENADMICYIDHGQIVEQDNHDELLAKRGTYYRLCDSPYAMIKIRSGLGLIKAGWSNPSGLIWFD